MLRLGERQSVEEMQRAVDGHLRDLCNVFAADLYRQSLRFKTRALANRTYQCRHILLDLRLHHLRICLHVAALQVGDDALEAVQERTLPVVRGIVHLEALVRRAVQHLLLDIPRQITKRHVHVEAVVARHALEILRSPAVRSRVPAGHADSALGERLGLIGNDEIFIHLHDGAETVAVRAGAIRRVERKHARRYLLDADTAVDARVVL